MVGHNPKLKMSQPLPLKAEAGASIRYFAFGPKAEVISRFIGLAKLSLAITLPGFGSSRRLDPEIIAEAKPTTARGAADLSAPKRSVEREPRSS